MNNNLYLFEKHAFRKHEREQYARSVINASLWDVMATGLSFYSEDVIKAHSKQFKENFYPLIHDYEFIESITLGTNQVNRVKYRFSHMLTTLKEVFGDHSNQSSAF